MRRDCEEKKVKILFIERIWDDFEGTFNFVKMFLHVTICAWTFFSLQSIYKIYITIYRTQFKWYRVSVGDSHDFIHFRNWMTKSKLDKMLTTSKKFYKILMLTFFIYMCVYSKRLFIFFLLAPTSYYSKRIHLTRNTNYDLNDRAIGYELPDLLTFIYVQTLNKI